MWKNPFKPSSVIIGDIFAAQTYTLKCITLDWINVVLKIKKIMCILHLGIRSKIKTKTGDKMSHYKMKYTQSEWCLEEIKYLNGWKLDSLTDLAP